MSVGKESESKGCFSVGYKGSTANSVALEKIRPSAPKAIVKSWNLFFKSLPIVAVFASPSNSAAHDKAHSQVLMLSMHFNPLPVLKFIAGKTKSPISDTYLECVGNGWTSLLKWGPFVECTIVHVCINYRNRDVLCRTGCAMDDRGCKRPGFDPGLKTGKFFSHWLQLCC